MRFFDAYLIIDWSAKGSPSPVKPTKDAIWVGEMIVDDDGKADESSERFFRTRASCIDYVRNRLLSHVRAGKRVVIGFDFAYGYPAGFAEAVGIAGTDPPWRRVGTGCRT